MVSPSLKAGDLSYFVGPGRPPMITPWVKRPQNGFFESTWVVHPMVGGQVPWFPFEPFGW